MTSCSFRVTYSAPIWTSWGSSYMLVVEIWDKLRRFVHLKTVWRICFLFVVNGLRIRNVIKIYFRENGIVIKIFLIIFFHFLQKLIFLIIFVCQIFQPRIVWLVIWFKINGLSSFRDIILGKIFIHLTITDPIILLLFPTTFITTPIIIISIILLCYFEVIASSVSKIIVSSWPRSCLSRGCNVDFRFT